MRFQTDSAEATIALGQRLAMEFGRPCTMLLIGNLGAGKTTLAKGIVEGYGGVNRNEVTSPTFGLIHEYGAGIFHLDLYRLETEAEVAGLGLDELFDREDAVVLIEWGERYRHLLPSARVEIAITREQENRIFEVSGLRHV